ncbi:hypothetical protein [Nocardia sienata]|uniref:hypothetical protein n=1 Tax=Nocardia sienata TaxID=248552 RepID=UPI0007A3916A|nr:hypothetical protein [Nocardia sienata]
MSETKDPRRTRRRASRTAGPPPAENAATEKLETGAADPGAGEKATAAAETIATGKAAGSAEQTGTVIPKAGAASAKTAKTEPATAATEAATEKETVGVGEKSTAVPVTEKVTLGEATEGATGSATSAESPAETVQLVKAGAETEQAGDDSAAEETGTTEALASGLSWKRIAALTAAAVLVIGLVAAAVVSVFAVQSTQQRDERRAEYVATARQTVLNLTTIRADTAKEDIDRILTMASGEFKTEFDGRVDPFTEIVKQAKVVSTGEVVEAAVERDDENSAVILVAAKQTLTNAGSQEQQQRFYRFRVTVQRADDGTLTASDVEFVA